MSEIDWRWADPTGQQRLIRLDELRAALSSGIIAPNAPVWREGWSDWQPAYAVPELTTSALAAANGVVQNIPPPPLEVVSVQHAYEGEEQPVSHSHQEPPRPPSYVPAPTHSQSAVLSAAPAHPDPSSPDATMRVTAASMPLSRPAPSQPPPVPISVPRLVADDEANTEVVAAVSPADADRALANMTPLGGLTAEPTSASAPPTSLPRPIAPMGGLAALVGMRRPLDLSSRPPPPSASAPPLSPSRPPPSVRSGPPSAPPASRTPPETRRESSEELSGSFLVPDDHGAGTDHESAEEMSGSALVPDDVQNAHFEPPAPAFVPSRSTAPKSQRPRPMSTPPPPLAHPPITPPKETIPLQDPSAPVILSDSVQRIPSSPDAAQVHVNTLLGMPLPGSSAFTASPQFTSSPLRNAPPPSSPNDPTIQIDKATSARLHDLTALLRSRSHIVIPIVATGAIVVMIAVVGIAVSIFRSKNTVETSPTSSASIATTKSPAPIASAVAPAPMPAPLASIAAIPASPLAACVLVGGSHVLAPRANAPIGIEVAARATSVGIAFATSSHEALALDVDPTALAVSATARLKGDTVRRAIPFEKAGKLALVVESDHRSDPIKERRAIGPEAKFDIGVNDGWIVAAPHATNKSHHLFPLDGQGQVDSLRAEPIVSPTGENGWAIAFRRAGAIWIGAAYGDDELSPRGALVHVQGLGQVGVPSIAGVGNVVFVAWADRASAKDPWSARWARWTAGEGSVEASAFVPPAGGLGSEVTWPSVRAIDEHRLLVVWSEGPAANHQVRAQTYSVDGNAIGAPFVLSGDAANAGQGQAVIAANGHGVVAYFAGAKKKTYELQAVAIDCNAH